MKRFFMRLSGITLPSNKLIWASYEYRIKSATWDGTRYIPNKYYKFMAKSAIMIIGILVALSDFCYKVGDDNPNANNTTPAK